jgi:hypothetical protein
MLTTRLLPGVPPAAACLGLAGVLPFAAASLASLGGGAGGDGGGGGAFGSFAHGALLAYGAVILSFLGGIQWGLAVQAGRPGFVHLGVSVLPSLAGWAALLVGGDAGLLLLAVAFVAVLAVDLRLARGGAAPAWFGRLRTVLTVAVVACLLLALLGGAATGGYQAA